MRKKFSTAPRYICYLSPSKIENLYSQLTVFDVKKLRTTRSSEIEGQASAEIPSFLRLIKAGISIGGRGRLDFMQEGKKNDYQKLKSIIEYFEKHNLIRRLDDIATPDSKKTDEVVLYAVSGEFVCNMPQESRELSDFITSEQQEANKFQRLSKMKIVSEMAILTTMVSDYTLSLACSFKYFSDMGCSRRHKEDGNGLEDIIFDVHPHSGNYDFFMGHTSATFDALFILSGQKGKTLYGSPLVLVNKFTPDLSIFSTT